MQSLTRRQIGFLVLLAATLNGALWTASPAATELAHPDAIGLASGSANDPIPADRASPSSGLRFAAATAKSNARPSSAVFERVLKHPELPIPRGARWQAVRVLERESLAAAFKREGIPSKELALLMRVKTFGQLLTKVRPGTELEYQLSADHQLCLLRYPKSRLQTLPLNLRGNDCAGRIAAHLTLSGDRRAADLRPNRRRESASQRDDRAAEQRQTGDSHGEAAPLKETGIADLQATRCA